MSKQKRLLMGAACLAVVLLWVMRLWSDGYADKIMGQLREWKGALPDNNPIVMRWRVGSVQYYQLHTDSSMQMRFDEMSPVQKMHVQMRGSLVIETLEVSSKTIIVGMQLSSVNLRVNGDSDPEISRALAEPFRVVLSSVGMPKAFEFPSATTAQHRSMLENTVRMFQVSLHSDSTWRVAESNASGQYEASYKRSDSALIEKSKHHFRHSPSALILSGAAIKSTERLRLDPQYDWIATMHVEEVLYTDGKIGPSIQINNMASLTLDPKSSLKPLTVFNPSKNVWNFVASAAKPVRPKRILSPVPQVSVDDARLQILAMLPVLDAANKGRTQWVYRLRDLLKVNGSLPAELLNEMQTKKLSDRTRADIYLAIELAGTESAQAALVSVVKDDSWATKDALRAIVALAGVDQPSEDTISALWDTVEGASVNSERNQLVSTATYALGSLGKNMKAIGDSDYIDLRNRLLNGALNNTGTEFDAKRRANYIHALGNTRDSALLSDVAPLLDDNAPSVRRAAALSLGMFGVDQVADQLVSRFSEEPNRAVRGAIVESLVTWTSPSASAVDTISVSIQTETDENTRYHLARFLAKNMNIYPQNRQVLKKLMHVEQSKRIRQNVAEALAEPHKKLLH